MSFELIYLLFFASSAITSGLVLLAMALDRAIFTPYQQRLERRDV
ncbi:hypothetical protein OHV05_37635 (plasmid) [Kitasatospora sp. NBC_00070]